jgi:hypothetical protein
MAQQQISGRLSLQALSRTLSKVGHGLKRREGCGSAEVTPGLGWAAAADTGRAGPPARPPVRPPK